jgi:hypothetical protein
VLFNCYDHCAYNGEYCSNTATYRVSGAGVKRYRLLADCGGGGGK